MGQAEEIFQGFKNLVFKNGEVEPIALARLEICHECSIRTATWCDSEKGGCGCYLEAKTRSLESKCPKGKW